MNLIWQEFLQQQGAGLRDGIAQHFGDPAGELAATQDNMVLCDLSQFGTLKVSGADAQSFLQNLFSSDVSLVNAQRAQLSSLNSPKGRVLASFLIWQTDADYFLHLPVSLCAPIQKKLAMYVLRAKVKIENVSDQLISIGLAGKYPDALLQAYFEKIPSDNFAVLQLEHGNIIRLATQHSQMDTNRFQLNITPNLAASFWRNFAIQARPAGSPCWDWLQIRAGIPVILPATQEQFVAQMVNLELIGGVSFKKGCYPGQEIVARMQYLGKLKRRMVLAHISTHSIPQAGDELYSADMAEQSCGMIVNAAPAPGGGYDVLAVVQISSRETESVHWLSLQGEKLEFKPLPYSFPKLVSAS